MEPKDFIGLTELDAKSRASGEGYYIEVASRDGNVCLMTDQGIGPRRPLTVHLVGGVITEVSTNRFED